MLAEVFSQGAWNSLMVVSGLLVASGIIAGTLRGRRLVVIILLALGVVLFVFLTVFWKNFASAEAARALDI